MIGTITMPEAWRSDPARGPSDEWWRANALGLQRVWPLARQTIETVARRWGLSPWLVLAKIESEQRGLSHAWDGSRKSQYEALGAPRAWAVELLARDGCRPRSYCDAWSLVFLLGVDKPRASTARDIGHREDGWFGPARQVAGCCLRFGALYAGLTPTGEQLAGLPPLPRELRGYRLDTSLYAPGVPVTRDSVTLVPANLLSAWSLAYMASMAGQQELRAIGLRLDPEAYAAETDGVSPMPTHQPVIRATDLSFVRALRRRSATNRIVVHHSDSNGGDAAAFHRYHIEHNGWAGIAYHYVILADGTIEAARPEATVGGHCLGHNEDTVGICVVGKLDSAEPTPAQVASLTALLAWLLEVYRLAPERVVGHRDLNATACPGRHLYACLPGIRAAIAGVPDAPVLRIGDAGALVRELQEALRACGYDCGPVDGDFGPRTRAAVLAFQREHDLEPDGIVGPRTRARLEERPAA